ncbi:MAG: flagellar biosynthetic protein FliR [Gammaproteobacteria bacterium]|nr:flagellar biosynthetic protein FliR [Gammaproteobacteria bacterium]
MQVSAADITAWIGAFLWPFFRIGAMLMSMAVIGTRALPVRVRLLLALAITVAIVPLTAPAPAVDPLSAEGLWIGAQQILIGVAMGFALRLVFAALDLAGESIGQLMGLGFASLMDPQNGVQVPAVSQFYILLATLMFLSLNGHLLWIETLAGSFQAIPVGAGGLSPEAVWAIVLFPAQIFGWAVRMALPVIAALLVVNVAFGVLSRASPQLNVFSVGFPVTLFVGLLLIFITLPAVLNKVAPLTHDGLALVTQILRGGR